jgi:hypothetical protein
LESGRQFDGEAGAGNRHHAVLQWLPKSVENSALELGGLVQAEHPTMCQRDHTDPYRSMAPAYQGC